MKISPATQAAAARLLRENLWKRFNQHRMGAEQFFAELQSEVRTISGALLAHTKGSEGTPDNETET